MNPFQFVEALKHLGFRNTFNPYSDRCAEHDHYLAPSYRRRSLFEVLEAATKMEIDSLWIGRDLGYRGGRRTGLALTDDVHLEKHAERWGVDSVQRPTKGIVVERTATIIWSVLNQIKPPVFLWNVFPLHPYEPRDQFTNRAHNSLERQAGEDVLYELILLLKPRRLIPIGNDAALSANRLRKNQEVLKVRHPSYGGQNKFLKQMHEIYSLSANDAKPAKAVFKSADLDFEPSDSKLFHLEEEQNQPKAEKLKPAS